MGCGTVDAVVDFGSDTLDTVVDFGSDTADSIVDFGKDTGDAIVDFGSDTGDAIVDFGKDTGDAIGQFGEDTYKSMVQPAIEITADLLYYELEFALDTVDMVSQGLGLGDITTNIFGIDLHQVNKGTNYLVHEAAGGNWKALATLAVLAVTIYISVITFNPYSLANAIGSLTAIGETTAYLLIAASYAMMVYSVYGVALSLETIGKYANNPNALLMAAQQMRDAMNLAFVNGWINGSMNLWRAGGILYDAPRAGDLKFDVTGNLNTVKFLNMQDFNKSTWMDWTSGKYHDFHRKNFGNMAGDEFFSVSRMA